MPMATGPVRQSSSGARLAQSESNLSEIIETAGKGAVLGGLTRPISGLIGNVRHLWMDEEGEPVEYTDAPPTAAPDAAVEAPADAPTETRTGTPAGTPTETPVDTPADYITNLPDYYE